MACIIGEMVWLARGIVSCEARRSRVAGLGVNTKKPSSAGFAGF